RPPHAGPATGPDSSTTWPPPPDPPGGTRARSTETPFDLHGGVLARRGPARPRRATRPDSRSPPALGRTHPLTTHPTPACERNERRNSCSTHLHLTRTPSTRSSRPSGEASGPPPPPQPECWSPSPVPPPPTSLTRSGPLDTPPPRSVAAP